MSRRVAVISVESGAKLVLSEFEHLTGKGTEKQLQLSVFQGHESAHGGYARLSSQAAGELETALRNWLLGAEDAA